MVGQQPILHRCSRLHSAARFCHARAERFQSSPCGLVVFATAGESQATQIAQLNFRSGSQKLIEANADTVDF
jgi:hypothetical protein